MAILNNAMMMSGSVPFLPGLQLWLDGSDSTTMTKAYQNLAATGSGTSGTTVITASGSVANLVQAGEKIRIGGTDIYTVASVITTTINTVETLSNTYVTQAMALDRISQWNDKSGLSNNATQGTALKQPVYNPTLLNSKSALTFDGANTMALPAALYTIPNGANTIFIVTKRNTEAGTVVYPLNMSVAGTQKYYIRLNNTAGEVLFLNATAGSGAVTSAGNTSTNFQIIRGRRSGTTQAVSVNNAAETTNASGTNEASIDSANIGSLAGTSLFLIGGEAEILVYNRSLSTTEMVQVEKYLSQKWAITIS